MTRTVFQFDKTKFICSRSVYMLYRNACVVTKHLEHACKTYRNSHDSEKSKYKIAYCNIILLSRKNLFEIDSDRSCQNHSSRHCLDGRKRGRPRKRWEDNIREVVPLRSTDFGTMMMMDLIGLTDKECIFIDVLGLKVGDSKLYGPS